MKNYVLKTNLGEPINHTKALSLLEAKSFFALMKNLTVEQLLTIFIVEEI